MSAVVHPPGEGETLQMGPNTTAGPAAPEEIGGIASRYDFRPA